MAPRQLLGLGCLVSVVCAFPLRSLSDYAGHDHGDQTGHDHGDDTPFNGGLPCGCEKDEWDHPFSIACGDEAAIRANFTLLSNCGTPAAATCKEAVKTGAPACQVAFFTLQAHHDYCAPGTLTSAEEQLMHDWESSCLWCKIFRRYDEGRKSCPVVDCKDSSVALSSYRLLSASCVADGGEGTCCTSVATQTAFRAAAAYRDQCDSDGGIPRTTSNFFVHAFSAACEEHACNAVSADYDGAACPSHVDSHGHDHGHGHDDADDHGCDEFDFRGDFDRSGSATLGDAVHIATKRLEYGQKGINPIQCLMGDFDQDGAFTVADAAFVAKAQYNVAKLPWEEGGGAKWATPAPRSKG